MNNKTNSFMMQNACYIDDNMKPYPPEYYPCNDMMVGYAYVPKQMIGDVYTYSEAMKRGTLFPELYKPMNVYGYECPKGGNNNE